MAEIAVSFLLNKLANLVESDLQLANGEYKEFVYLRGHLERIRAFLRDADVLEDSDEELKVWVRQVRDVAHDAEDLVDEFTLLKAHDHGKGLYGSIRKVSCSIKNMKARYRIDMGLKGINIRIIDIFSAHKRLLPKVKKALKGSSLAISGNTCYFLIGLVQKTYFLLLFLVGGGDYCKSASIDSFL